MKKSMLENLEYEVTKYQMDYQDTFNYLSKKVGKGIATKVVEDNILNTNSNLFYKLLEIKEDKVIVNKNKFIKTYMKMYRENNKIS